MYKINNRIINNEYPIIIVPNLPNLCTSTIKNTITIAGISPKVDRNNSNNP